MKSLLSISLFILILASQAFAQIEGRPEPLLMDTCSLFPIFLGI